MSVYSILNADFLAELPDDPQSAFAMVLRRAESFLSEAYGYADANNDWSDFTDAKYAAMNSVIAAARTYKIEPFAKMSIPRRTQFTSDQFDDFKSDLDHYAAQLLLDNSIRNKRDAITIAPKLKDRLRQHLHGIKTLIDQADMPEPRRATLHKKLSDFEAALEKPRVNVVMLAGAMVAFLSVTANVSQIADSQALGKLVSNFMSALGQAKAADEAKRVLPALQPPQPALPPRSPEAEDGFGGYAAGPPRKTGPRETFSADLDDEIPF